MKKETKCCCDDELYGGAQSVFCDAVKSIENRRAFVKKALKPAEDKVKELEKDTATDKVRLQGTKETKAPNLKPYTECKHVKDRKDLGPLIEAAKKEHRPWKVERSKKEGFRYVFVTKVLKEEKLPKGVTLKKDAGNIPLNVAHFNKGFAGASDAGASAGGEGACCGEGLEDKNKKEQKIDLEVAPIEDVMPKDDEVKEEKPELTMAEVFTKYFDMHGNEDHSITVCLKGCMDKEDCPCITTEPLSDEEYELLKGEFHEEEPKEEVIEESLKEEHKEETTIEADKVETTKCEDGECKEKTEIFTELPDFDVEVEQKGDKVEIEIEPKGVSKKDDEVIGADDKISELDLEVSDENNDEELEEASTAEKRAYRHGGQDYTDLLVGRALARVKDKKSRDAAIASIKAGREEVAKQFIGDRKEQQADTAIAKKMNSMQKVGLKEAEGDEASTSTEATVDNNLEIKLDDLQFFKPVAGARDTWEIIVKQNKIKELAEILKDFAKDGKMTTTDLNDMLWFEKQWVFDKLEINPDIKSEKDIIDLEVNDEEKKED